MDGTRSAAAAVTMTLGGKDYGVRAVQLSDRHLIEREIVRKRINPLKVLEENLPKDPVFLKMATDAAFEAAKTHHIVTPAETVAFISSLEGTIVLLWLMIRHNDPQQLTLERVTAIVSAELDEVFQRGGEEAFVAWKSHFIRLAESVETRTSSPPAEGSKSSLTAGA